MIKTHLKVTEGWLKSFNDRRLGTDKRLIKINFEKKTDSCELKYDSFFEEIEILNECLPWISFDRIRLPWSELINKRNLHFLNPTGSDSYAEWKKSILDIHGNHIFDFDCNCSGVNHESDYLSYTSLFLNYNISINNVETRLFNQRSIHEGMLCACNCQHGKILCYEIILDIRPEFFQKRSFDHQSTESNQLPCEFVKHNRQLLAKGLKKIKNKGYNIVKYDFPRNL